MARQRRAFKSLPEYLKTKQNDREYAVLDDVMFEPENADFLLGFIGSGSLLTPEDLERTPLIQEDTPEKEKYQLSIGTTYVDPETQERLTGAFYTDLLGQISANGGIVDDPNRVFSTNFYSWNPPFDFDKHINFSRYFWMVEGSAADINGVYLTKEPEGSLTVVHEFDGVEFIRRPVKIVNGLPPIEPAGTIVEDANLTARLIFKSDGTNWVLIETIPVADIPTDTSGFLPGEFIYVGRTGPDFNRPLVWLYSHDARRWITQPVVVSSTLPDTPREGMVWEDIRIKPQRILKRFTNGAFVDLTWVPGGKPTAPGNDGDYIYDDRNYRPSPTESADNEITDPWTSENWWRHFEDLSPSDRNVVEAEDQAVRPIIEFWAGIEPLAGDIKDVRNDPPLFEKYAFVLSSGDIVDTGESTTIFQYQVGTSGRQDSVLEFPLVFNNDGEFLFDLTLETDASAFEGYKYFKDTTTGYTHSIWSRSDFRLEQTQDANGLYDVPRNLSSNPDHEVLTEASRAQMLNHLTGIIESQDDFTGTPLGPNSYRWSERNPAVGATIIDPEQTLLRAMGMLQTPNLDFPTAVRRIQRDYNKVIFRFENKLDQFWDAAGKVSDPAGNLLVSASDVVDAILTELFVGRTDDFPYFYSGMGEYEETRIDGGIVFKTTPITTNPIFIPPSPPRVGASQAFKPSQYTSTEGTSLLRGHEGYTIRAYADDRNLVWLELQDRFFDQVQDFNKDETPTYSSRFTPANFHLTDYYGNYTPFTSIAPVDEVVQDLTLVVSPAINLRVFAKGTAEYASWDGNTWLTRRALTDDIFFNNDDGEYYIYNGKFTNIIQRFERPFDYDYSTNEYRNIIRREFERLLVFEAIDFTENDQFDINDKFTWNYGSAGVEGNYRGQYRRLYNSIEPQVHAWEVVGYSIEPDWWRTEYVPDSTAPDGTPRYGTAHPMWADFQAGIVNPISGLVKQEFVMTAPIPVDSVGELLDPISAGVVDEGSLDNERIDDSWRYGDGAPVEQTFYDSTIYPYVVSLAGYLMKNGIWVDTLWSEVYITIGEQAPNTIATAPHTVHRDTSTRPAIGDLPVHLQEDDDGNVITRLGINAWVSEFQQLIGASPTEDFGKVIQNTEPALAWQTSGYINAQRTIVSTLSGNEIPFDDIHTILYQSQPIETHFCSGVIIIRENNGYRVFGTDPLNPSFRVDLPALPSESGQVELRQSFTAIEDQHEFVVTDFRLPRNAEDNDTTKVSVLADGQRIKPQHIRVTGDNNISLELALEITEGTIITVSIITTPSNPSTQIRSFKISGVGFSYAASGTGNVINIEYGRFFSTSSEVINFMLGYGRVLENDGWVFDTLDDLTGKTVDWMLGAQKFAAWVMDVESMWNPHRITPIEDTETFTFSPISSTAKFISEFGSINNVESIQNGAYGIINVRSEPIEADDTFTSRTEDTMLIEATGDEEIYGVRLNVVENQHVVFFSNITRFNDVIYAPILAIFHETLRVDSYRTNDWNGRMEADGYMIDGGSLLPNFEKQAFDFTRFYDRIDTPDNPLLREQARNLYGWAPNDSYMDQVEAADRTRFDYFRGMIQTKGTLRPITAYTRGTRLGQDNVFVYEDWAWKLQPFGDQRVETVQFNVDKIEINDEAQVICFGAEDDPTNRILEIQDFNRKNTVVGTVVNPAFLPGDTLEISNASNTLNFTNIAALTAIDLAAEINADMDAVNMVGVVADVIIKQNNQQLAFRNTDDFIGTDYTLVSGTILGIAGLAAGTYNIDNDRWIIPPFTGQTGISNIEFPIDSNGFPNLDGFDYFAKVFDTATGLTKTATGHFDPEIGEYEQDAFKEVDYDTDLDPARYNIGPEVNSSGLAWGEEQVGQLWWDTTRRLYVDYRRPFDGSDLITFPTPDYETSSAVWGSLLFYHTTLSRDGSIATAQTFDIFNGDPVAHGLSTGDIVSTSGANEPEWNIDDIVVELGPVSVTGTIPFQEQEAAGTIFVPAEISVTGDKVFDENINIVGTTVFDTLNSIAGDTPNPTFIGNDGFGNGDNFSMTTSAGTFNFEFPVATEVIGVIQEINAFFTTNGIQNEVEAFNDFDNLSRKNRLGFRNPGGQACKGSSFRADALPRVVEGGNAVVSFSVGDNFAFETASNAYGFTSAAGGNVAAIAAEINTRFANPPAANPTPIVEFEAFDAGGNRLGFRNTAGFEGEPFNLIAGGAPGNDLLTVAGIAPGIYQGMLQAAGFQPADIGVTQEIIPGEDFAIGTGSDFSLVMFSDLLNTAGIDITSTDSTTAFSNGDTIGSVVNPVFEVGDNFEITIKKNLAFAATAGGSLATLVGDINTQLLAVGIIEVEARVNGIQLEFANVSPETTVTFELLAGTVNDLLAVVAITPGTYTNVVGTATAAPTVIGNEDFTIDVNIIVNFTASSTSLNDVITEINDNLTSADINDVDVDDNAGGLQLRFKSTGNDYSLRSTKRLNYINQVSGNAALVVSAINSAIGDNTDITSVEAYFTDDQLSFRNSLGKEGTPFILISGTQDDMLALAGITPGAYEIIPAGLQFNIITDTAGPVSPYETESSGSLDSLVADINLWLEDESVTEVIAENINQRLTFRNSSGNGGERFQLVNPFLSPDPNNLLDFAEIFFIAGSYFNIIPALANFDIETSTSGGVQTFTSANGGNLDTIVAEINSFFVSTPIVEVEAVAEDNKLVIRNTTGFESQRFVLTSGTPASIDLLGLTGITAQAYGPYPAGYGFGVITQSAPINFVTQFGGTLDAIVEEFNNFVGNLHVPEVEAVNSNDFLTIQNTTEYAGSTFTMVAGSPNDMLPLVGIAPGPYASDPTKFTFTVEEQPPETATGNTRVNIGAVDLYEWVVSPVPPDQWEDYTSSLTSPDSSAGVPLNVDDASYVERKFINSVGSEQSVYYFWVKGNDGSNPAKNFSSSVIADVLASPISRGVPWFAPMDANYMNIYTGGVPVEDSYAIEVTIDRRDLDSHIEWVLVSEGDQFKSVPAEIVDKLIDSMSQIDERGSTVPSPWLSDTEKMGACLFPIQTVFNDVQSAIETYVESLNSILDLQNLGPLDSLVAIFPLSDEFNESTNPDGYWMRQDFILSEYKDDPIFDTVVSIAERDFRGSQNAYANGDLIKVEITNNTDPFEEAAGNIVLVGATYVFDNGAFLEIGIDNHTVNINTNVQNNTTTFRSVYNNTYDALITGDQNDLMFSLLHEMNRQNITCDWFIKTSYISTQVFDKIIQSGYVRPDETVGIINNINDVKPFRTKLRAATSTLTISNDEDVPIDIFEFPAIKISLIYDRLSCNMIDDGGWDSHAWDTISLPGIGWDKPLWEFEEQGTEEWYIVEDQVASGIDKVFTYYPAFDPELYQQRITIFDSVGNPLTRVFNVITTPISVTITFDVIVPTNFIVRLEQTQGFYQGGIPTLGPELEDTLFEPTPSTYEHAVPRTVRYAPDSFDPRTEMIGCSDINDELGGRPEERIIPEVIDSCHICVTNTSTEALAGWDATPWDTSAWDSSPADVGDRVFFMCIGSQEVIPPGVEIFPTSEDFSAVNAPYIIGSSEAYVLVEVKVQVGGIGAFNTVIEGVEYEKVEPFNNILVFGSPPDQEIIADGVTTIFNVTIPTGLSNVRLNGVLLTAGVDYLLTGIVGNEFIDFSPIQPPPRVVEENFIPSASSVEADGSTTEFEINLPSSSLSEPNVFVWINDEYITVASNRYEVDTSADVVFSLASIPADMDLVRIFGMGNTFNDATPLFSVQAFNGNNVNTGFLVGNNATDVKTFVFVDGTYQSPGVDYTIAAPGTAAAEIQFTIAPPTGTDNIEIRVIVSPVDIQSVVESTFPASGGASDVIPGVVDAIDPDKIMLFVNGVFQDIWTALGTPDATLSGGNTINWTVAPTGGDTVSFRMIRSIAVSETTIQDVVPIFGDVIDVNANPYLLPGDIVKLVYNGWPVGPLGPFEVTSIPVPADEYDVINGILVFDAPVEDDTITITYKEERKGDLARSILTRMPIVVDEISPDHLLYDDPLGFTTSREIGEVVVDTTLIQYFQWDGSSWNATSVVGVGDQFFVKKTCEIWEYDGTSFNLLFEIGDAFITPPVLDFPLFGHGITFGTYAYGSAPNASVQWPEAYQIMQHPGSCES